MDRAWAVPEGMQQHPLQHSDADRVVLATAGVILCTRLTGLNALCVCPHYMVCSGPVKLSGCKNCHFMHSVNFVVPLLYLICAWRGTCLLRAM